MIRLSGACAALLALVACNTAIPNDVATGVSSQYEQERAARLATLRGTPPPPVTPTAAPAMASPAPEPVPASVRSEPVMIAEAEPQRPPNLFQRLRMRASTARDPDPAPAAVAAMPAPAPAPVEPPRDRIDEMVAIAIAESEFTAPPVQQVAPAQARPAAATTPTAPQRSAASNPRISDEQEFDAVASRETIESDAERRARMQAERVVVAPTAVPDRPSGLGPNVIAYALSTTHDVGEGRYSRSPFGQGRHEANCRAFRSPDLAQEWFLANGGPSRDRRALDPDGDGFACAWNPEIYRVAARN